MKILSFTTLFPNAYQPIHGIFVENRLRHLLATRAVQIQIVAPVPWFPVSASWTGHYGNYAKVPKRETRHGIEILHPRYPVLPKIGMSIAPLFLAYSQIGVIQQIIREGYDFDLLDAHYFYPDGVAAIHLGRWFNKPVVITARGTDLNQIPNYSLPRRQIQWAAHAADGLITVCQALKDSLVELGVAPDSVTVLRNGVDLDLFRPLSFHDRAQARARFSMTGFALVSVGQLTERKGHHLIISALPDLPGTTLHIAGAGPEHSRLLNQAQALGVSDRVFLLGALPHENLPELYCAADASVLASSREGWANVLLESMACGTPVVASRIWGTPEVVAQPAAGLLVDRNAQGIVEGIKTLRTQLPDRTATRNYAEKFSWDATTDGQLNLFSKILGLQQSPRETKHGTDAR